MKFGVANIVNDRMFGKEISNDRFLLKRMFGLSLAKAHNTMFYEKSTVNYPFSNLTFLNLLNSRISTPNLNTKIFFENNMFESVKVKREPFFKDVTFPFLKFFLLRSKEFREHFRLGYRLWLPFLFKIKYSSGLIGFGSHWIADDSWVTKRFKKYGFRSFKSFRTEISDDIFSPDFPHRLNTYFIYKKKRALRHVLRGHYTRRNSYLKLIRFQFFNIFKDRASYIRSRFFF
jgi:hypothetical protein